MDVRQGLDQLDGFAKRVRRFAAGGRRGGLGGLHQEAQEAIRTIERLREGLEPQQLTLGETVPGRRGEIARSVGDLQRLLEKREPAGW